MPLSPEMRAKSLRGLCVVFPNLNPQQLQFLQDLNNLAATNDVLLSDQSESVIRLVGAQLVKMRFDDPDVLASIYSKILEQMDKEANENKRQHNAQGHFDLSYIHQRPLHDQLQDHDMVFLMPRSQRNIDVLAPVNRFDKASIIAVQSGIAAALENKAIDHIVIPIGPGHWRGIYLTKPTKANGQYQLELFDPYGPVGAAQIKEISLRLLQANGIEENQVAIRTTGPHHPQMDGYACGDFTCAHSHLKIRELAGTDYNQQLVSTLEEKGNQGNSLRLMCREMTARATEYELTPKELNIVAATTGGHSSYKQEVMRLIKSKQSIYKRADAVLEKERKNQPLTDEELATKLQAEELRNAGLGRK